MLAEIPFVRMRGGIPQHLLDGKTGFSESIKFARQLELEPTIKIDRANSGIWVADVKIPLTDVNFIFYLWLLGRSIDGEPIKRMSDENPDYAEEYLAVYEQHTNLMKDYDRTQKTLNPGMSSQWISERISAVKKSFEQGLGPQAARPFVVQSTGGNNNRHYHIALTEEQVSYL
jgi:hypothetical protein